MGVVSGTLPRPSPCLKNDGVIGVDGVEIVLLLDDLGVLVPRPRRDDDDDDALSSPPRSALLWFSRLFVLAKSSTAFWHR